MYYCSVSRPGSEAVTALFFSELTTVLEQLSTSRCPIIVCGDLNIHFDVCNDSNTKKLGKLLDSSECKQQVHQPMHTAGHTLDLVITRSESNISCLRVGEMLSDHALVIFKVDVKKLKLEQLWTTSQSWRNLSLSSLETDLKASRLCADMSSLQGISVDDVAELYGTTTSDLLDKHCPVVKVCRKIGPLTLWFDAECRQSRRYSRMLERRYRRTRSDTDRLAWVQQLKKIHLLYEEKNHQHWMTKIADSKRNMKKLWQTLSFIMGEKTTKAEHNSHTVNDFANFFIDKVEAVRLSTSSVPLQDIPYMATHILDSFTTLTPEQVEKMIYAAQGKTCQLDPARTWIVKEFRTLLSPFIARLFNESLATSCFPERYKHAIITPRLKKSNIDASQLKSYRPVSNLPFLMKLLEKQFILSCKHFSMPTAPCQHISWLTESTIALRRHSSKYMIC